MELALLMIVVLQNFKVQEKSIVLLIVVGPEMNNILTLFKVLVFTVSLLFGLGIILFIGRIIGFCWPVLMMKEFTNGNNLEEQNGKL